MILVCGKKIEESEVTKTNTKKACFCSRNAIIIFCTYETIYQSERPATIIQVEELLKFDCNNNGGKKTKQ